MLSARAAITNLLAPCYPAAMRFQAVQNLLLLTALAAIGAAWLLVRVAL